MHVRVLRLGKSDRTHTTLQQSLHGLEVYDDCSGKALQALIHLRGESSWIYHYCQSWHSHTCDHSNLRLHHVPVPSENEWEVGSTSTSVFLVNQKQKYLTHKSPRTVEAKRLLRPYCPRICRKHSNLVYPSKIDLQALA